MKSTKISVTKKAVEEYSGDLLICLISRTSSETMICEKSLDPVLSKIESFDEFIAKPGQSVQLYPSITPLGQIKNCKRVLLVGIGDTSEVKESYELNELFRRIGGLIAKQCKKNKAADVCISLQGIESTLVTRAAEYLAEGVLLGDYSFTRYKKKKEDGDDYEGLSNLSFSTSSKVAAVKKCIGRASNSANSANIARDMANEPGNKWTPTSFANHAKKLAKNSGIICHVLGKQHIKKLGMGGIIAVNQGSKEPPKLIILDYKPGKKGDTILLVGKGLTFDSGGISLKPAAGMMDMKYDMCGGAAVLSAMETVVKEKPDVRVVAIIPATDNMPGSEALKPGDVITHYGGITSEIENTDAEGRLILADALTYGIEKYKPSCVIDLATLTGAVIIALGHHYSGLFSNNDHLVNALKKAGDTTGEPLWQLPLGKAYSKQIDSKIADVKNTGGRPAGSSTAAAYLQKFIGDTPWAHLDIAGTAWDFTEKTYIPKGPSGVGTRTLIELIRKWKKGQIKK